MTTATTDAQQSPAATLRTAAEYSAFTRIVEELCDQHLIADTCTLTELMAVIDRLQGEAWFRESAEDDQR